MADWALERVTVQNPCIRAFLGCIRVLEDVLESSYAILHCSPTRLAEIWERMQNAVATIRLKLEPLLQEGSPITAIEESPRLKAALEAIANEAARRADMLVARRN